MHVDLQYAEVATVGEVRSEGGELGKVLYLQQTQVWQHTHPLRDLSEAGVVVQVYPVERVDAWVEVVSCEEIDPLCLVEVSLLIGTRWRSCFRYPLIGSVPRTIQNAIFRVNETIVREIELSKVGAVPFQDIWNGTETVVGDVESFQGGKLEEHFWQFK